MLKLYIPLEDELDLLELDFGINRELAEELIHRDINPYALEDAPDGCEACGCELMCVDHGYSATGLAMSRYVCTNHRCFDYTDVCIYDMDSAFPNKLVPVEDQW